MTTRPLHQLTGPTPEEAEAPTPGASSAAEIEALSFEDEGPGPGAAPGAGPAGGLLSRDQFAGGLRAALGLTGGLLGLATLRSAPELPTFAPAADALYDTASEVPWLRWLISPDSVWLQRTVAIAAFAVPVAGAAVAEARGAAGLRAAAAADRRPEAPENGDSQAVHGQ